MLSQLGCARVYAAKGASATSARTGGSGINESMCLHITGEPVLLCAFCDAILSIAMHHDHHQPKAFFCFSFQELKNSFVESATFRH